MEIDREVKRYIVTAYDVARKSLSDNREKLIAIAEALLEREVLDGEEVKALIEGRPLKARIVPRTRPTSEDTTEPATTRPATPAPRLQANPTEGLGSA